MTRWVPLAALALAAAAAVLAGLAVAESVPVWTAVVALAAALVAYPAGRRIARTGHGVAVLAGAAVLDLLLGTVVAPDRWSTGLLVLGLAVGLPWLLARSRRQQAELAATAGERARLQERARIAREMHDTLGHELALFALRAGALELAPDLPEQHRDAAAGLRAGAGQATERLATIISVLREGGSAPLEPPAERIDELVDRSTRAGVTASLDWAGPRELPAAVDRAAYRVVQEGLTNAMKHSPGSPVSVRLTTAPDATVVEVTNPVPNPRSAAGHRPGGAGLDGLRERLRPLGGSLHCGARDRTYRLQATLPHRHPGSDGGRG